jgi:hypothetical protein
MGVWRVSMGDTPLDKAIKVCVVRCWHPVTRKWEAPFVPIVYKEVPLFRCITAQTILRTYVAEYESHKRMVLLYIIQRTGQSIGILSRSCSHWRSTHLFLHRFDSPSTTREQFVVLC